MAIIQILSPKHLIPLIHATIWRFPTGVAAALVATVCGVMAVDHKADAAEFFGVIGIVAVGVMVWSVAVTLSTERRGIWWVWGASIFVVALGALYYSNVPHTIGDFLMLHTMRTGFVIFSGVLFLCVAPFVVRRDDRSFWFFVMRICARFTFAVVVAATFYAGIAAALASVHYLFGVSVEWEWYVRVWIVMAGFVAPLIFMAGIPRADALYDVQMHTAPPRVVRIFAQYVLVPLLALYAVILYAYGTKILLTRVWPQGGVGYMVLIFASMGLVTTLMLAVDRHNRRWIPIVSRAFFIILLPTLVLLGGAIYVRIADYGWTPSRYIVVLLGIWFCGLSLFAMIRKNTDLRIPFLTLIVLVFVSLYGPWSMFAVSVQSQVGRLAALLDQEGIRMHGTIAKSEDARELSYGQFTAIQSRVRLLADLDALDRITPWFAVDNQPKDLSEHARNKHTTYDRTSRVLDAMGVTSTYYSTSRSSTIYYHTEKPPHSITVTGYDYYIPHISVRIGDKDDYLDATDEQMYAFSATEDAVLTVAGTAHSDSALATTHTELQTIIADVARAYGEGSGIPSEIDTVRIHGAEEIFDCTIQSMEITDVDTTPHLAELSLSCLVARSTP